MKTLFEYIISNSSGIFYSAEQYFHYYIIYYNYCFIDSDGVLVIPRIALEGISDCEFATIYSPVVKYLFRKWSGCEWYRIQDVEYINGKGRRL